MAAPARRLRDPARSDRTAKAPGTATRTTRGMAGCTHALCPGPEPGLHRDVAPPQQSLCAQGDDRRVEAVPSALKLSRVVRDDCRRVRLHDAGGRPFLGIQRQLDGRLSAADQRQLEAAGNRLLELRAAIAESRSLRVAADAPEVGVATNA